MKKYLIELIGEQPVTNLLSIRYQKPEEVLFIGTREHSNTSRHLRALIGKDTPVFLTEVNFPYEAVPVYNDLLKKVKKIGWKAEDITVNISGGTRMMAFAAFHAAREYSAGLSDIEYINHRYIIRQYSHDKSSWRFDKIVDKTLPPLLTVDDYFHAHLPGFSCDGFSSDGRGRIDAGGQFEQTIANTLQPHVDEIFAGVRPKGVSDQIEIDLVVRNGNNIGLIEAKTGAKKQGIDQLDTAGSVRYLGNHVMKFLITGRYLSRAHKSLAYSQQVHVIELPEYRVGYKLSSKDTHNLLTQVNNLLRKG